MKGSTIESSLLSRRPRNKASNLLIHARSSVKRQTAYEDLNGFGANYGNRISGGMHSAGPWYGTCRYRASRPQSIQGRHDILFIVRRMPHRHVDGKEYAPQGQHRQTHRLRLPSAWEEQKDPVAQRQLEVEMGASLDTTADADARGGFGGTGRKIVRPERIFPWHAETGIARNCQGSSEYS